VLTAETGICYAGKTLQSFAKSNYGTSFNILQLSVYLSYFNYSLP